MTNRDKQIIADLVKFRVMTRDDIVNLHFNHLKNPVKQANVVLKRLTRDGHIEVSKETRMYRYFPTPSIKKNSTKIPHYLEIVDFYKQLCDIEMPRVFDVEPKYGDKGTVEPDIFTIWHNTPFFVEIQRSIYSKKAMDVKMKLYQNYFYSDSWKQLPWQPKEKKVFPRIWIVSDHMYSIISPFKVVQSRNVEEFMSMLK